jgi:hypothetical protein
LRNLDGDIPDLKITDKLLKVPLDPQADYPQILIYAAQREKTTHDFYVNVARKFKGTSLSESLATLLKKSFVINTC